MMASSLKAISLGLSVLPAFAGNPSLRGLASAEEASRGSTLPSWCNTIPASSWTEIPDCGGATNTSSSTEGIPSWCANVPARAMIAACAQQRAAISADVQDGGVQLEASQLPVTPEVNIPAPVPGVTPAVHLAAADPTAIAQSAASNVADPFGVVQRDLLTKRTLQATRRRKMRRLAETSKDTDLQASQLPVTPAVNVPAVVPAVTPTVHVPPVDPNAIVQGATSNVADPNAIVQGIIPNVPVPIVGANLSSQKPAETESESAEEQGFSLEQAADSTLLASSATPSWCNDIPSAGQQYIAACGGSADGNDQSSAVAGAPSWCDNIPAASRADILSCAHQDNAPISASARLEGSSALFLWGFFGTLFGTVAYA